MIDPRKPDFDNTPDSRLRPRFAYAPLRSGASNRTSSARTSGDRTSADVSRSRQSGVVEKSQAVAVLDARGTDGGSAGGAPMVTIATAFYNAGEVFRATASCVFGQSLQAWEWVIVNDGTTDPASLALLDEFRTIDPRVRVVDHDVNRGLSAARNTAFKSARTEYIFQLDSDDLVEPTVLEKCLWYIHTHPEAAFVSTYVVGFGAQQYLWEKGFERGREFLRENLTTPMGIIRRSVFDEVGGYDEENRGGMEDWDFWLNCAAHGHWGATIPEFLSWYRRRDKHWDSWENLKREDRIREFQERMRSKYEPALAERFPYIPRRYAVAFEDVRVEPGVANPLAKEKRRLLLLAPWLQLGGADKFNIAMVRELASRGWEISIATTLAGDNSWLPEFTKLTPDVFVTPHFLRPSDTPAFIRYLIESRDPDVVMLSNSEMGHHMLPYLRTYCPKPAYVDYVHMEEPWWKNGGHPRYSAHGQAMLELNIVSSEHLKRWQASCGADPERIAVCTTSACESSDHWRRDEAKRAHARGTLGIPGDQPVMLYAGRIVEQKRPRVFARVMQELAAANMNFTCLVAGDGPDMGWLRWFLEQHGLTSRVRLLGAVPYTAMHELMSASDIFFLPSLWEGIAISIFEAMSMELAVVGADVGGQLELVTPDVGVLVQRSKDDEREVADYTAALISMLTDNKRRTEMGRRARKRIRESFEPSHMGDRMLELFAKAERLRDEQPRPPLDRSFAVECARRGLEYLRAWEVMEAAAVDRSNIARELEAVRHDRDAVCQQRDQLAIACQNSRLIEPTNGVAYSSAEAAAQRIIAENMRYVAADRLNDMLKSMKMHSTLKAFTVRMFRRPTERR